MATLGSLTVNIVARTEKFTSGVTSTVRQLGRLDAASTAASRSLGLLKAGFAGVASAVTIGALRAQVGAIAEIVDMADRVGATAEGMQRLGFAAEQSGTTIGAMARALTLLNKAIDTARQGSRGTRDAFASLALSAEELLPVAAEQRFFMVAKAIERIGDVSQQTAVAMKLFGRGGAELLPLIRSGELQSLASRASVVSEKNARSAATIDDQIAAAQSNAWAMATNGIMDAARFVNSYTFGDGGIFRRAKDFLDSPALTLDPGTSSYVGGRYAGSTPINQSIDTDLDNYYRGKLRAAREKALRMAQPFLDDGRAVAALVMGLQPTFVGAARNASAKVQETISALRRSMRSTVYERSVAQGQQYADRAQEERAAIARIGAMLNTPQMRANQFSLFQSGSADSYRQQRSIERQNKPMEQLQRKSVDLLQDIRDAIRNGPEEIAILPANFGAA